MSSNQIDRSLQTPGSESKNSVWVQMVSSWATPWTSSTTSMAIQASACLVVWEHLAPGVGRDLLGQWGKWDLTAEDMEVALGFHMVWVATEAVTANMAWAIAHLMASPTMVLALSVSPKDMASLKHMVNPLPMASNILSMINSRLLRYVL